MSLLIYSDIDRQITHKINNSVSEYHKNRGIMVVSVLTRQLQSCEADPWNLQLHIKH